MPDIQKSSIAPNKQIIRCVIKSEADIPRKGGGRGGTRWEARTVTAGEGFVTKRCNLQDKSGSVFQHNPYSSDIEAG
jgi:hypothetical protein